MAVCRGCAGGGHGPWVRGAAIVLSAGRLFRQRRPRKVLPDPSPGAFGQCGADCAFVGGHQGHRQPAHGLIQPLHGNDVLVVITRDFQRPLFGGKQFLVRRASLIEIHGALLEVDATNAARSRLVDAPRTHRMQALCIQASAARLTSGAPGRCFGSLAACPTPTTSLAHPPCHPVGRTAASAPQARPQPATSRWGTTNSAVSVRQRICSTASIPDRRRCAFPAVPGGDSGEMPCAPALRPSRSWAASLTDLPAHRPANAPSTAHRCAPSISAAAGARFRARPGRRPARTRRPRSPGSGRKPG